MPLVYQKQVVPSSAIMSEGNQQYPAPLVFKSSAIHSQKVVPFGLK